MDREAMIETIKSGALLKCRARVNAKNGPNFLPQLPDISQLPCHHPTTLSQLSQRIYMSNNPFWCYHPLDMLCCPAPAMDDIFEHLKFLALQTCFSSDRQTRGTASMSINLSRRMMRESRNLHPRQTTTAILMNGAAAPRVDMKHPHPSRG